MPKKAEKKLFLADVAPIVPLPFGKREVYSYLSSEPIPVGSLVLVPFGPREVRGVVLSCSDIAPQETTGRLKRIRSVLEPAFLTGEQLAIAKTISDECLTPLGRTFRHFLPTRTKERVPKIAETKKTAFRSTVKETALIRRITKESKPMFLGCSREDALRLLAGAIRKLPKNRQALILVPERIALPGAERFFASVFSENKIAVLSSSVSSGTLFSAWERTRSGEARIIVGTRQALFAPFRTLGLVALLEEAETLGYKQWDMSPRYDARNVAETLAALHGAKLLLSGETESESIRHRKETKTVVPIETSTIGPPRPSRIVLVNMREERFKKNYSLLSTELKTAIHEVKNSGKKSLLIVSRSGLDRFSVCEECKTIPRCPSCDRALRSSREGHFKCGSCSFRTTTFPRCEKCGSLSFKSIGGGTEKIEQELHRHAPGLHIVRIDERAITNARTEGALLDAALATDVVIGTPSTLNMGALPKLGLAAILDAENILSFPDFQADERFVRLVRRIGHMVEKEDGNVILQAFRPEQELLRSLRDGTERLALDRALEDRKMLRYPPFFSLFRIGFRTREATRSEALANEAYQALSAVASSISDIRISPPRTPLAPKVRGKYERFIIISLPEGTPFPKTLRDTLLPFSDWTFDPNPLSLI